MCRERRAEVLKPKTWKPWEVFFQFHFQFFRWSAESKAFHPQPGSISAPNATRVGLLWSVCSGTVLNNSMLRQQNLPWIGNKSGRCRIPSVKLMFQQFSVLYHTGTFAVFVFLLLHKVWPHIYCTMTMVLNTFRCWHSSWHKKLKR